MTKIDSTVWCECGDALETKSMWVNDKKLGRHIDHWEYYCFGCDRTYVLVKITDEKYRERIRPKAKV